MSTADRIRQFIASELKFNGSADELTDDYPLLESEVVDSMGIHQIVGFLEDELDVEVDDEDLVPDNFMTITDITNLVDAKSG